MKKGKERHLFPGNNTSIGFYSYYDHILPQREANHIFCLKGGPGVGKSTFMKTIGKRMNEKGYDVEYLHCSSDPDSLDGVVFPQINISMIDGTAPHVVDPINPGAVDEIINLGEYWNLGGIKQNKDNVININTEVGFLFKRAYKYIAAAKCMIDDVTDIYNRCTDLSGAVIEADSICKKLLKGKIVKKQGKARKQFASAITPKGIMHYIDSLYDDSFNVYLVKNNWGVGVSDLLERVADQAMIKGYNTELYYCPMEPASKVEHLIIPELKIAFISESKFYSIDIKDYTLIDLCKYTDNEAVDSKSDYVELSSTTSQMLLTNGVAMLFKAKQLHDDMEKYYVPHMDFDSEKLKLQEILDRILDMA